jgi:hypothetical protein
VGDWSLTFGDSVLISFSKVKMSMKNFLVTHNIKNIKCSSSSRWRRRISRSAAPAAELKLVSIYKEEENLPR